jgi:hypothetical protein
MYCADFVGTAAMRGKQHGQRARRMNWLRPVESALRKLYNPSDLAIENFSTFNCSFFLNLLTMATINMNAIQFNNPSPTAPSLSARCTATLQKHCQSTGIPHRKEWSRVLESYRQSQNTGKDIAGKQDDHCHGRESQLFDTVIVPVIQNSKLRKEGKERKFGNNCGSYYIH